MEKVQIPKQHQTKTKKSNWKPLLQEIGIYALKGFVTGVSMRLGGMAIDKSFKSNNSNLKVLNGGRSVANG